MKDLAGLALGLAVMMQASAFACSPPLAQSRPMSFATDSTWLAQVSPSDRRRLRSEFERRAPELMGHLLNESETVAVVRARRFERQILSPPAWDQEEIDGQTGIDRWASYSEGYLVGQFEFETLMSLKGAAPPAFTTQSDLPRRLFVSVSSQGWDGMGYGGGSPCFWRATYSFGRLYAMGFNAEGQIVGALSFGDDWPVFKIAQLVAPSPR